MSAGKGSIKISGLQLLRILARNGWHQKRHDTWVEQGVKAVYMYKYLGHAGAAPSSKDRLRYQVVVVDASEEPILQTDINFKLKQIGESREWLKRQLDELD